jgi:D-glycero-D-manno-heptose 1,7-bisphosphate phosphatase
MLLDRFRLIIFDADDTLRRTTVPGQPCPYAADQWELLPNVRDVLSRLPWTSPGGPRLGLASNQDHVGYGHLTLETARSLLRDLAVAVTGIAPPDAALQLCPHPLGVQCACRKPKPEMLLSIMRYYGATPKDTVFVGDSETDRRAAEAAGIAFVPAAALFRVPVAP